MIRRVQIESDDIAHLLEEEWVRRELEVLLPMGLQTKGVPDALDGGFRDGLFRPRAPGTSIAFRLWASS